jgi:2-keto-3-deoxy-L-fuconate dehydrogenase
MTGRVQGKVAVVTAAAQGIGRATADLLLREGAQVWATDIAVEKLEGFTGEVRRLDVTDAAGIAALVGETGPIDILVNAAGWVHHGSVLDTDDADWDRSFDINVKAMHRTIRAFAPGMLAKGAGSIVNIASGASSIRGIPNRHAYGASKAAVIGLTKAVAADFMRRGVRCNAIAPGTVDSPSLDGRIAEAAKARGVAQAVVRQEFVDRQPIGRLGTPEEIGFLALHLASDEAGFTTGAVFSADGGFSL